MKARDIKTAEQFGILERCKAFERDLLKIRDVVPDASDNGIPFDLDGFLSGIFQVIITEQIYGARDRLCERLGVDPDADPDLELLISGFESLSRACGKLMYRYGYRDGVSAE